MSPAVAAPPRPAADHRRSATQRTAGSRPARRVSGPVGGRLARTNGQRTGPRRVPREHLALGGRALALVRGLPDNSLIDRLVRGRAWIPVLGVLLAGIVAMQVEILKLGASIGRAMERSSTLQTQNETLQASVASLADDQRIERLAAGMGMVMSAPGSLVFLTAHPGGDIGRAIANIHTPDPTGFLTQLAAQAAAVAALAPTPPSTVLGSATPTTLSPGTTSSASAAQTTSATTSPSITPAASSAPAGGTGSTSAPVAGTAPAGGTAPAASTAPAGGTAPMAGTAPAAGGTQAAGSTAPTPSAGAGAPTGAAGVAPASSGQPSASGGG